MLDVDALAQDARTGTFAAGGSLVAVRCAGELHWRQLRRSLLPGEGPAALSLDLWDPDEVESPGPEYRVGTVHSETIAVESGELRYAGPDFDVKLDRLSGQGSGWVRAARVAPWHALRPWQSFLAAVVADAGVETFHAAMVSRGGAGVLLPGPNGHGKSSVSLACVATGMDCLGDDAVAVEATGGIPVGHTFHAVAKLSTTGLRALPELFEASEPHEDPTEDERAIRLAELEPPRAVAAARVAAVAFPRLAVGRRSAARPLRPGEAVSGLLRNALSALPGRLDAAFGTVTAIASEVPAYALDVGTDPAGLAAAVEELLL